MTEAKKIEVCRDCKYFIPEWKEKGYCHFNPPVQLEEGGTPFFPRLWEGNWCGQWSK